MTSLLARNARSVLLPAFDGMLLSEAAKRFLDRGGVSILIGETREEYVNRQMSVRRRSEETAETFLSLVSDAKGRSDLLLAAVDQEMGGICRLHDLVPSLPPAEALRTTSEDEIEEMARTVAVAATGLGVNMFLAPMLDVPRGPNLWLEGRTWSDDALLVARLSAAYVRGLQAGGVAATGKHFPGYGTATGDPAIDVDAVNPLPFAAILEGWPTFEAAIAAGVEMVMVGPAIVEAIDPNTPALRSADVVRALRHDLGFQGIVMADDLDSKATLRGDDVATVAVEALAAGCDLLLLADTGEQLEETATAIEAAVRAGLLSEEDLASSADRIRDLGRRYGVGTDRPEHHPVPGLR